MGPLSSALLAVILAVLYALAAYIVLRILRRRAVPFTSIAGVVVGSAVGAVLAILVLAPFFAGKTIQSTVVVVSYLSSIVGAAIAFGIVRLKFVERRKT